MNFFQKIKSTFTKSEFYELVSKEPVKIGIKFYLKLGLLMGVLISVLSAIFVAPLASKAIKELGGEILSSYPEGLVLNIKGGEATSNLSTPSIIPLSTKLVSEFRDSKSKIAHAKNLLVIDTVSTTSLEYFESLDTVALLSRNFLVYYDKNSSVVFSSLKDAPNTLITKDRVSIFISYGKYLPYLIPFIYFIGVFSYFLFTLLKLGFIALIFLLISNIAKLGFRYKESYNIVLYASVLPMILHTLLFFGVFIDIPFLFAFLTLLIALLLAKKKPEQEVLLREDTK